MNTFYTHYYIKSSNKQIESIDEFTRLRIGAILQKDTGDEYIKTDDNVFDKIERRIQSTAEADAKYAFTQKANTFTKNQNLTASPSDNKHIVNKEYVDTEIIKNKVDTTKFARIDASNVFEYAQVCTAEPLSRAHLTNRAYVDDSISAIMFDASQLAKLNKPNVFTSPQSCTAEITSEQHLTTKKYVDDSVAEIVIDTNNFVRSDMQNTFSKIQNFANGITISPDPTDIYDGVNKKYVDAQIEKVNGDFSQFVKLDSFNTFTKENIFNTYVSCKVEPTLDTHLVTKKYVDLQVQSNAIDDSNYAKVNKENNFSQVNYFEDFVYLSKEPLSDNNPATKKYVDTQVENKSIAEATTENYGIVKISSSIENAPDDSLSVPTDVLVKQYIANNNNNNNNMDLSSSQVAFGEKTFANSMYLRMTNIVFGDEIKIDEGSCGTIYFTDINSKVFGKIQTQFSSDKTYSIFMYLNSRDYIEKDGEVITGNQAYLGVEVDANNNVYARAINPKNEDISDSIATTSWVKSAVAASKISLRRWIN